MRFSALSTCVAASFLIAGCWEDPAGPSVGPVHDTLTVHDTLRTQIHDTVEPPIASCAFRPQGLTDSLVGDFAPLSVGNEWVYRDTALNWTSSTTYWSTSRSGTVKLKLVKTFCKEDHLEQIFEYGFEGKYRKTQADLGVPVLDSSWMDSHKALMTCRDDGSAISCGGLAALDEFYLRFFRFHRVQVSEVKSGTDPLTGQGTANALYSANGYQFWKGAGAVEMQEGFTTGATCCGHGTFYKSSLVLFNRIDATRR